jgi:hypothetical protein
MDSHLDTLETIRQAGVSFLRTPHTRVLSVAVDDVIRDLAIEVLAQIEWNPANRCQVIMLAGGEFTGGDGGWWRASATRVRQTYSALRTAYAKAGHAAPEEFALEDPVDVDPLHSFARVVGGVLLRLMALDGGPDGVIMLVAPRTVADPAELAAGLAILIGAPALAKVRWICAGASPFASAIGARIDPSRLQTCDAGVDASRQDADVDALLLSIAGTAADSTPRPGCASPSAPVPAHPTDPPPPARDAPSPGLPRKALAPLVKAVRALRRGDPLAAIRHQREVCDVCIADGLVPLAVEMELLLAAFAIQACVTTGAPVEPAVHVLQSAVARAEKAGLHLQAAKANYVLGTVAAASNDNYLAGGSFRRAASAASEAGSPALQIEALRAAGERLLELGSKKRAAAVFEEAAAAGRGLSSPVKKSTSLALVRRRLDELDPRRIKEQR